VIEWIPAFAGMTDLLQQKKLEWIPAFAGMTDLLRQKKLVWISAFAGMTDLLRQKKLEWMPGFAGMTDLLRQQELEFEVGKGSGHERARVIVERRPPFIAYSRNGHAVLGLGRERMRGAPEQKTAV
jgi:hypothetical protein